METIAFYRDRETGAHPIFDSEVRRREPNTLFGTPLAPEDWDTLGVDPVYATERPEHDASTHSVREGEIAQTDGVWRQTWVVEQLPPLPTLPIFVYKLDLFERSTEEEAEQIVAAIGQQSTRIRMIFEAAQSFREDHELWTLLSNAATQMFGADRAAELLAPSEG